jgi:hypothetical protein
MNGVMASLVAIVIFSINHNTSITVRISLNLSQKKALAHKSQGLKSLNAVITVRLLLREEKQGVTALRLSLKIDFISGILLSQCHWRRKHTQLGGGALTKQPKQHTHLRGSYSNHDLKSYLSVGLKPESCR